MYYICFTWFLVHIKVVFNHRVEAAAGTAPTAEESSHCHSAGLTNEERGRGWTGRGGA